MTTPLPQNVRLVTEATLEAQVLAALPDNVASLDVDGTLNPDEIPEYLREGNVAPLDAQERVPQDNLPTHLAPGVVAPLVGGKLPEENLPDRLDVGEVATLDNDGRVPQIQLPLHLDPLVVAPLVGDKLPEENLPDRLDVGAIATLVGGVVPDAELPTRLSQAALDAAYAGAAGMAVFDVKAAEYGAIGNGTADDTAAVASAITALAAAGGGILYFPKGIYLVTGLTGASNMVVRGAGMTNSVIKTKTGTTATSLFNLSGKTFVLVEDLGFDGSDDTVCLSGVYASTANTVKDIVVNRCAFKNFMPVANASSVHGAIYTWSSENITVTNCLFTDNARAINLSRPQGACTVVGNKLGATIDSRMMTGIFLRDSSGSAASKAVVAHNIIDRANADPNNNTAEGHGISVFRVSDVRVLGNTANRSGRGILVSAQCWGAIIDSNTAGYCDDAGIRIEPQIDTPNITLGTAGALRGAIVSNNVVHDTGGPNGGIGLAISYAAGAVVTGNVAYRNAEDGINTDSDRVIIMGNTCYNNWFAGTPAGALETSAGQGNKAGIRFYAGAGVVVIGNVCFDNQTTKTQSYGLSVKSAAQAPILLGNSFAGNAIGEIDNPGHCVMGISAAWNGQHLVLGTYHLWIDATGALRSKNGVPTSDTDGSAIGAAPSYDSTFNGDHLELGVYHVWFGSDGTMRYKGAAPTSADDGARVGEDVYDSNFDGDTLALGTYHVWFDSTGKMRYKNGVPTSELDGTEVGSGNYTGSIIATQATPPDPADADIWVNTAQIVYNTQRTWIDTYAVTGTGDVSMTLGNDVLGGLQVFKNGLLLYPVGVYTVSGRTITINGCVNGDKIVVQYEYDADTTGAPAASDLALLLIDDHFNRANSTANAGTAPTGQTWLNIGTHQMGITGNQMYRSSYTNANSPFNAYVDAGFADIDAAITVVTFDGVELGLAVRYDPVGNSGFFMQGNGFYRRSGGVSTKLIAYGNLANGTRIRIVCVGSQFAIYTKTTEASPTWVLLGNVNDPANQTKTGVAVRYIAGNTISNPGRFDNLEVRQALSV